MFLLLWPAMAGGDVRVAEMSINGLVAHDVVCELQGFDLTWLMKFQATLGESKIPGDACVGEQGVAIRVRWNWAADTKKRGKATVLQSSATEKQTKCLTKVLSVQADSLAATCTATLLYGDSLLSKTAADKLSVD